MTELERWIAKEKPVTALQVYLILFHAVLWSLILGAALFLWALKHDTLCVRVAKDWRCVVIADRPIP